MTGKREDYLNWDEYFMSIALLSAKRSKDPSTQVGACIVNQENHIVSVGYNGFPNGCSDDEFPWSRDAKDMYDSKYTYVAHAELNAVINAGGRDMRGATIYVALFPCNECAKVIIQSGIREVVYISDKYADTPGVKASKRMFAASGVAFRKFVSDVKTIDIDLQESSI